ncbi:endo-alpha-N-acetylgalactosaminidase family protein [Actinospica sp.]|uniref:endo-alpha-N-acetylgalactosaminidase family protein n=1 Tax=Actinospica sp. TaxID=1872142 RepID=UPI002BD980F5|nr:endo-alpha-N-acetylgalactosaminidase family protein [Actinospica sp.]HWG25219.1 endo-alpha-N-acetylgalactosaminidase family protein [Actinospica sp.]
MRISRPRRLAAAAAAAILFALTLQGVAPATAATGATGATKNPTPGDTTMTVISSDAMDVIVDTTFPDVLGYQWKADDGVLGGHSGTAPQLVLNGTAYTPTVTSTTAADHVDYVMKVASIGATLDAEISVANDILDFKITKIVDGKTPITTVAIPGQALVSVSGNQTGAQLADANIYRTYYAPGPSLDTVKSVKDLSVDAAPVQNEVAILSGDGVSSAIWSSAIQSYGNLLVQTTASGGVNTTAAWSNTWTYRGNDGKAVALPEAKVVLTGDRNADGKVDWQDGATAYREIMTTPVGASEVSNNVVSQIAFNMSSQAETPFIETLDDIKKVDLNTDGLGQSIEVKGYQDQGHDTGDPDYAGDWNVAAGGLPALRTLVAGSKQYNAIVGVHINDAMESMDANAFRWSKTTAPTDPSNPYVFQDTDYMMNTDQDLASGDFATRVAQLTKALPDLGFVYTDAFFSEDWDAWKEANVVNGHGLPLETEFPTYVWPYVDWYHDSNEYNNVGINSQIMRFIYNSDADAWIQDSQPMLGGAQNVGFEGWHGGTGTDYNAAIANVFTNNLPTKWLQSFQITDWQSDEIDFTGGVKTTMNGKNPEIWQNGVLLRDGADEFLPYDPSTDAKIYAWSGDGQQRTWTLPTTWDNQKSVTLYELTQTGKADPVTLQVNAAHQVTLNIKANTPYVVYPSGAVLKPINQNGTPALNSATASGADYGQGGIVKDPEFYTQSFADWTRASTTGSTQGVTIGTDAKGFQYLQIAGADEGQVSQTLTGLTPGTTYAVGAWVKVVGHRTASIQASGYGGQAVANSIDAPTPPQDDADSRLYGQDYQRLQVLFTPTAGHTTAVLSLIGGADSTTGDTVSWTDAEAQADPGANNHPGGVFYAENFEHVAQGWGPFIPGISQEQSAMLSTLNPGYTRDTIGGDHSLQTIDNGKGLQFRTWPGTIAFQPGHAYRVQLDYQTDTAGLYDFQVGADGRGKPIVDIPLSATTNRALNSAPASTDPKPNGWTDSLPPQYSAPHASIDASFTAGSCGSAYLGLYQNNNGNGSGVIDNLVVTDLGPAPSAEDQCDALSTLTVNAPVVTPGKPATVTSMFTNTSKEPEQNVDLATSIPSGWTATGGNAGAASVAPGAKLVQTLQVTPSADAAGQANVLAAHATYTWNGEQDAVSGTANAQAAYANLAATFNDVGVTDNSNTAPGAFDGGGDSFSAQELAADGATPGASITFAGTKFAWPDVPNGTRDNTTAQGQLISVSGSGTLGFLASAAGIQQSGALTVNYIDGTSSTATFGVPNWCCETQTDFGAQVALKTVGNNAPTGNRQNGTEYDVFYNSVALEPGKEVSSIVLPANSALHFFAVAASAP